MSNVIVGLEMASRIMQSNCNYYKAHEAEIVSRMNSIIQDRIAEIEADIQRQLDDLEEQENNR